MTIAGGKPCPGATLIVVSWTAGVASPCLALSPTRPMHWTVVDIATGRADGGGTCSPLSPALQTPCFLSIRPRPAFSLPAPPPRTGAVPGRCRWKAVGPVKPPAIANRHNRYDDVFSRSAGKKDAGECSRARPPCGATPRAAPPAQSVPLVLGTSPPAAGSIATAARSARANALNAASQIWWSFLPATAMCAVIPAWLQRL